MKIHISKNHDKGEIHENKPILTLEDIDESSKVPKMDMAMMKEHECQECGHKFSKLSKMRKHISKKHPKIGEINDDNLILTLENIGEHSKVPKGDETMAEDAQESFQEDEENVHDQEESDFMEQEHTCQICGLKFKGMALTRHFIEPCAPAWLKDFLSSPFVQSFNQKN